jgi:tripartite-type tricarboxylate transporter receptor subunit TctC
MFAPARAPAAVIQRHNQEMARTLNEPGARTRLFNSGMEVVGSTPEQLTATVRLDIARWGKLIRDAGIRNE